MQPPLRSSARDRPRIRKIGRPQQILTSTQSSVRRRLHFPRVSFRLGAVALLAVLIQVVAIRAPLGDDDLPRRILLVASYALLLIFVAANVRRPGIAVIGAGLLLNFLAIVANGGLMAITQETLLKTGDIPDDAVVGEWLPGSKDILLEREDVRLWALTDRLTWDRVAPAFRAFSIGDVVIVAGLVLTLADLFLPRFGPDGFPARLRQNRGSSS